MGRGEGGPPTREATMEALEALGRNVAEAIARGQFDLARELTEAGIRLRSSLVDG